MSVSPVLISLIEQEGNVKLCVAVSVIKLWSVAGIFFQDIKTDTASGDFRRVHE
jgi:hypothetical protein